MDDDHDVAFPDIGRPVNVHKRRAIEALDEWRNQKVAVGHVTCCSAVVFASADMFSAEGGVDCSGIDLLVSGRIGRAQDAPL